MYLKSTFFPHQYQARTHEGKPRGKSHWFVILARAVEHFVNIRTKIIHILQLINKAIMGNLISMASVIKQWRSKGRAVGAVASPPLRLENEKERIGEVWSVGIKERVGEVWKVQLLNEIKIHHLGKILATRLRLANASVSLIKLHHYSREERGWGLSHPPPACPGLHQLLE